MRLLLPALASLSCSVAMAADLQGPVTGTGSITTTINVEARHGKGAHLRPQADEILALIKAGQLDAAEKKAIALQRSYEALFDPGLRQHSFHSDEELAAFSKSTSEKFEWIDAGYHDSLQLQAFIAASRKNFDQALAKLRAIEILAPLSASTSAEIGFVLNQTGKPDEGLAAYGHALDIAEEIESQQPYRAIALRGMGYSLIELGALDEAELTLNISLELEPANETALHELGYIRMLRQSRQN